MSNDASSGPDETADTTDDVAVPADEAGSSDQVDTPDETSDTNHEAGNTSEASEATDEAMTTADDASKAADAGPKSSEATSKPTRRGSIILLTLLPLVILGGFVAFLFSQDLRQAAGTEFPPIEELVFERVILDDGSSGTGAKIILQVRNDGPDPIQIAQVLVDEAYWAFTIVPESGELGRLSTGRIEIPYHWLEGEAHEIMILTSTGVTFNHSIDVAIASPTMSAGSLGFFALMGIYVGVIPIIIGLLWFPALRQMNEKTWNFILFLTIGLLLFLGIDTVEEGLELAGEDNVARSFHPSVLFFIMAIGTYLLLQVISSQKKRPGGASGDKAQVTIAYMIALGIGLHNLGEGLAIGAAYNAGELALGATLVVGFALHNTTEGLAIVSPLARHSGDARRLIGHLVRLGLLAGGPTVLGAWIGGFSTSAVLGVVFMAIGAGAIFQVVYAISAQMLRKVDEPKDLFNWNNLLGLASGFTVMFATALLV